MNWLLLILLAILQAPPKAATVPHQATLYYQSADCTTSSPCQLLVYRTACSQPNNCPNFGNGHGWTRLTVGSGAAAPTNTGTTWVVVDQDPALQDATTYAYVGMLAWQSSPNQTSQPGPAWQGTTAAAAVVNTPPAPTLGTGNSVN